MAAGSGAILEGITTVGPNGALVLDHASVSGEISLQGTESGNARLTIMDSPLPVYPITGFSAGDFVDLKGITTTNVTKVSFTNGGDTVVFTMRDGSTQQLNLQGAEAAGYKLTAAPDGHLVYQTCFLKGTLIETSLGPVAVEDLRPGMTVVVYGETQTRQEIIWVGMGNARVRADLPQSWAGYPVRIRKGAIADNVPDRDLRVTAEHCLYIDGRFIPARMLVNGLSIVYETDIEQFDYYHVETCTHSVICANNTLTESYLDTGNRVTFDKSSGSGLHKQAASWSGDAAAPLGVSRDVVEPIYHRILSRTAQTGCHSRTSPFMTEDPGLRLKTKQGRAIHPTRMNGNWYIFHIAAHESVTHLLSRRFVPAEDIGAFIDDRRQLGVLVGRIKRFSADRVSTETRHLSAPSSEGWNGDEATHCRWTNGEARLDIPASGNAKVWAVEIVETGRYQIMPDLCAVS